MRAILLGTLQAPKLVLGEKGSQGSLWAVHGHQGAPRASIMPPFEEEPSTEGNRTKHLQIGPEFKSEGGGNHIPQHITIPLLLSSQSVAT